MSKQPASVFPSSSPRAFRPLPDRPDLAQLKRQAKELLRRYAADEAEAVKEVQQQFHPKPDHTLTLSEAQLVLARSYGYDSWPKLKAYVDGVNKAAVVEAINRRDVEALRSMLKRRPELADASTANGEQSMVHLAVMNDDAATLRLLMELGADARRGIWPHRDSTTALVMAQDRGLDHLVSVIREVEQQRQEAMTCPNTRISPEQEQLAALIKDGRDDEAIAMLAADPTLIKQCDLDGGTPLHVACEFGREKVVDWLCDRQADARKHDALGHTPLDRVVLGCGLFGPVRLVAARPILDRLRRRGCVLTPLGAAALGETDALRQMHREAPGQLVEGFTWTRGGVLSAAVMFDCYKVVEALLDLGLDPNEPIALGRNTDDEEAWSWGGPLWRAAQYGYTRIAELLMDRGADPNANVYASGWPLDRAYERGDQAMVDLLYARGAKPSPYTVCAAHDLESALRLLSERGEDAQWMREMSWSSACALCRPIFDRVWPRLMVLQDQLTEQQLGWHDLLCQPLRMTDPKPTIARHNYNRDDRFTIFGRMLDDGVDPNVRGRFGLTVLHWLAAQEGQWGGPPMSDADRNRFVLQLLDAGADPSLRDSLLCSSALGWACRYGREALVALLLERGVAANEPDAPAWATPLAWATKMGHERIKAQLREAGATV